MWGFKIKTERLLLKRLFQLSWEFWGGCRNLSGLFRNLNAGEQALWSPAFLDPSSLSR